VGLDAFAPQAAVRQGPHGVFVSLMGAHIGIAGGVAGADIQVAVWLCFFAMDGACRAEHSGEAAVGAADLVVLCVGFHLRKSPPIVRRARNCSKITCHIWLV